MTCQSTLHSSGWLRLVVVGLLVLLLGLLTTASAQYQSSYPYSRIAPSRTQLPRSTRHIGGFTGNPYKTSQVAPSGLPVSGNRRSYYGGGIGEGSFGYRAPAKPFSNLHRPQPLVSGTDAARIEIARGLWRY